LVDKEDFQEEMNAYIVEGLHVWGPCVVRGPVDGRFLVWWVIDNVV
jgi:hypothetical protein